MPFDLPVLYEDERIIVVDKPHFLATTPRGMWYRQTALLRLQEGLNEPDITPAHRLDRLTAGVLVLVRDPAYRGAYQLLFEHHLVRKTYQCLAPCLPARRPSFGTVSRLSPPAAFPLLRRSRLVKDRGRLQAYEEPGTVNAETVIQLADQQPGEVVRAGYRLYDLYPVTGKTHQLRVHMNSLGLPIVGDPFYPDLVDRPYDDFSQPLELVARTLEFDDPVDGRRHRFRSQVGLGAGRR
ncbi:pseudouridine synthase [Bifidobacterium aemilianum]|uniref:pseudouridine synthase n=1 Tax=Bifidobacterium aemilianum TaxID=2493120 RepID=UPI001EED3545|nr:pseudouridine synthase [Bifidobacterium aemilianum]